MCLAFCETENWKLRASNGNASIPEIPKDIWVWKRLCVIENGEVREPSPVSLLLFTSVLFHVHSQYCYLLVLAFQWSSPPPQKQKMTANTIGRMYISMSFSRAMSRVPLKPNSSLWGTGLLTDLLNQLGFIEKRTVSRRYLRGSCEFSILDAIQGAISFFWINPEGHFITQNLRILPRMLLPLPNLRTPESSTLNLPSLPLPNPFKKQKSDEVPLGLTPADAGRAVLGDVIDGGLTISQAILVSSRVRVAQEKLLGLIWTEEDLIVSVYYY